MKERFLESLAILLGGLFSAERSKHWQLGDAPRARSAVVEDDIPTSEAQRPKN